MILLLDNFDSFTYNLVDYFGQLGIETHVLRNNIPLETVLKNDYQGVVLSPGPEKPASAGNLMTLIGHYLGKVPMLGICLGHQAIGQYLGAKLEKANYPMHGKISGIKTEKGQLFQGLPETFEVVRYHSLMLKQLPVSLKPTAYAEDGTLMAFESEAQKAFGIQFHPEAALTEHGLHILRNWARFSNIV